MVKAVVGANWGDEGKGKITDMLAKQADIIVRFQGGANAGHTRNRRSIRKNRNYKRNIALLFICLRCMQRTLYYKYISI